jgi:hypothetical protein
MLGLVTAIYDGYDTLKPYAPQSVDVDAVCVTDDPLLTSDTWRVVYEPRSGVHPNRAAKGPKCLPWDYTEATSSVWIDAAYRVVSPNFVDEALSYAKPIAQFVHPWRACIFDEATVSLQMVKYHGEPIEQQIARYMGKHPAQWGLWATGVIARRHTADVRAFGNAWLFELMRYSFQDQLSEPYALRELGLRPESLPGNHLDNAWLSYEASGRH